LFARVIAFVGDNDARLLFARRQANFVEIARGRLERRRQRGRVALVGRMDRRRHHDAGVEIDRMLGLVGEMRRSVLHLGDPGVRVGRTFPVGVRKRLAFALAVETRQILGSGRIDAALLRHARQHLAIALTTVASHDGA
jgi:phosphatidylserine/phosphatidylglycerophosphate/cardiolipin synthase-like enzyme